MSPLNPLPEDAKNSGTAAGSGKWMSSKMRLMRKLRTNTDMVEAGGSKKRSTTSSSSNNNNLETGLQSQHDNDNRSRVCSDCSTTKTPLWRGGPRGPKSLCNACGIRQRKARKAMGVVAASSVMKQKGTSSSSSSSPSSSLFNDSGENLQLQMQPNNIPIKKRCKILYQGSVKKKMTLDDLGITNFNWSSDVNEAAKLLMALSSDIICG